MKKFSILFAAVLSILAAASCNKEEAAPEMGRTEDTSSARTITTISATLNADATKTALGEKDGSVWPNFWKEGDQISVNGVTSQALDAEADGKKEATFTFEGTLETPYCAAYPAAAASAYSEGSATITLPATQSYVEGSYDPAAFIMSGQSVNPATVSLTPNVSLVHLILNGSASIRSVKLTGAPEATLSGSFTTAFDGTLVPQTVSNEVTMEAATPVALPAEFFIAVPAGLSGALKVDVFDNEGGTMTKNATVKSALAAGQMYSAPELSYVASYDITISAQGITSSTAVICWDNAPTAPYTIEVFNDSGCSSLNDSYAVDAGNDCWSGSAPRFCISGLDPDTTYYVKVTNTAQSTESNVLPVTTAAFDIVEVSTTPAEAGDVILAEDFSELRWDCDMIGGGAGWFPTEEAQAASFTTLDILSFQAAATSNEKQLSSQMGPLASSRLMHWAQGANKNIYIHPGYLKLVGSKKVTHIVTPALTNIPDGKIATLEVEVTASAYFSESSGKFCTTKAIVAVQPAGEYGELVVDETNTLDLSSNIAPITLSEETAWNTYKVTISGVSKGDRLAFGADKSISGNDARMNLSDIKVTIVELLDPGDLTLSLKSVTSSTACLSWTHIDCDAAYDIAYPYTAAIYSDKECKNLVVSHDFEASASCWDGNSPCFSFGGLLPATDYWCVVTNTEEGKESNPVKFTTEDFTVVDATTVADATVGDVILAEDFSEIGWGPDILNEAAGFEPSTKAVGAPSGANPSGSFIKYDNTGSRFFGAGVDLGTSRLSKGWGFFGNSSVYLDNAYSRVGASGGRTHMVTPALAGIPDGKLADIEVTITATKYDSGMQIAAFAEKGLSINGTTDPSSSSYKKYTGASLSDGVVFDISTVKEWETKTVTLTYVDNECQLLIGSLSDNSGKNRYYFKDIVVTITAIHDHAPLVASVEAVSSSSASIGWTYGGAAADDIAYPYTAALYSDAGCTSLVVSHHFDAEASCWGSKSPCFSFGGLAPSTTYWCVVTNTESNEVAAAVSFTTEAFTTVDATTVSDATVGDVILAEDFSEIGWGPDEFAGAAGFYPSPKVLGTPSGVSPTGGFTVYDNTGQRIFGTGVDLADSRLSKGWGFFGNSAVFLRNAYLRIGSTTSGGRTHLVTPALSGIPAGKLATIEVTVTATKMESNTNDVAVFVEKGLSINSTEDTSSASYKKYTGAALSEGSAFGITKVKNWETKTVSIADVDAGCQLVIGSYENVDTKNRFCISDVVVTIVALKDPAEIQEVVEINDFDTFKAFLTSCASGLVVQGNVNTDITLSSEQLEEIDTLYPIDNFYGVVNGNNHTINGLTKPLFDELKGTVSDLTLNSTLDIADAQNSFGIFANTATDATLTGCVSMGSLTSSASEVSGTLSLGGMIGIISGCTLTDCHNLANVTNSTTASDYVRMGGLVGAADGANTLTGNSTTFNYNKAIILENSESAKVAVGGVCGYTFGAASDFAYAQTQLPDGDDVDDIIVKDNTRDKVYVGGIIGMSANTSSFDYAKNIEADVCLYDLTMSATGQVFAGGVIGGWSASGEQTITGCSNSGWVYTKRHADGDNYFNDLNVGETATPLWSCFGGIAGMGSGTSEGLNGGVATITGKTFNNCTMTGRVLIYGKVRCCIGGVIAYTENDPTGCVCTGNIRLYKKGGIATVGDNYHRQICGGVVGYFSGSTATNLKYQGTLNSNSSSPFAYTGGVIGYLHTSAVELKNCRVGGSVRAAGSGNGRNAVMCHNNTNTVSVTFTDCLIKKGLVTYATGSKVTISADSAVTAGQCMSGGASNYTIVGDVLPTVADSI